MIDEKARVLGNRQLMPGTYLLEVDAPACATQAQPGQFAMINVASNDGCTLRRPLSIHRAKDSTLVFLYSVVGKGTHFLSQLVRGQRLSVLAPLGNGFRLPSSKKQILLLAGGRGIAPLVFLAERALENGFQTEMLVGARSAQCLYPGPSLPKGIVLHIATEDGSNGYKGRITELLLPRLPLTSYIYACGPVDMYKTIGEIVHSWQESYRVKLPEVQVSLEARMACGVGACYGCVIKTRKGTRKVCSDGPVFDLKELLLEEVRI